MKERLTILILILFFQSSYGQTRFELNGLLIDCSDSSELILGHVYLLDKDSVIETAHTDDKGHFKFKGLKKGSYQLRTDYFYYPSKQVEINVPIKSKVEICLTAEKTDSLLTQLKLKPSYTIYYFGLPKYSDRDLNKIGEKYGVKWLNLGCVIDDKLKKYNEMINKILTYRNGEGWKGQFWSEVEQEYNKNKARKHNSK